MRTGLTPEEVIYRLESGETQADIARSEGCSRQYVSALAKRAGWENPFKTMAENIPWEVDRDLRDNTIYKNVRRQGIWQTTGKLSDADLGQLRSFIKKLETFNVVVDYGLEYPPNPGFTNTGGFAYVPREEEDEDYIIKIRPGIKLTPIGRRIWRKPTDLTITK